MFKIITVAALCSASFLMTLNAVAQDAPAAPPQAAETGCIVQASIEGAATELKNGAQAFLAKSPLGGGSVVRAVRSLLVAEPAAATDVVKALTGSTDKQAFSIGVGMGQAAAACAKGKPEAAAAIQQAVAASGNASALSGFSQAFGNLLVAATGGNNGGGGGGLPGGTSSALGTGFDGGGEGSNGSPFVDSTVSAANRGSSPLTGSFPGTQSSRVLAASASVSPTSP